MGFSNAVLPAELPLLLCSEQAGSAHG
jgi:hypothetical protein